jgi:hypothetical protein
VDKVKQHFEEITDAWRLYRKYAGIRNDEDDKWAAMLKEAVAIQNRHNNSPFVMRAVMMFMELLEDEAKCIG